MSNLEPFFTKINYSASNEDGAAELDVLRVEPSDRVFCITGSGARTLDLLTGDPSEIVSIDFNKSQNFLLQFKMAAYHLASYREFSQLLGLVECNARLDLFRKVEQHLDNESAEFWRSRRKLIERGVLYCGSWERWQRRMASAGIFRRRQIRKLWNAPDLQTQGLIWKQHWSGRFMKGFIAIISNRFLWERIIREPGARLIPQNFDVANYIKECLDRMVSHSLLRSNPWANLLFFGRYLDECHLPPHLSEKNFGSIRDRLNRITIVNDSINRWLTANEVEFNAFSLSDFSSYADANAYQAVWEAVVRRAATNAKFCERFFLVPRGSIESKLDPNQAESWQCRLTESLHQSQKMAQRDHTGLYSFRIGTVTGKQTNR